MTQPSTTGDLALEVMRKQAALFAEHVPQARLGADPEHVHDSRVATRRLRAALRLFGGVVPNTDSLDAELRWIASQLGAARDLDVQLKRLHVTAESLGLADALAPYAAWLEQQREQAQLAFDEAFQSDRFVALTDRLRAFDQVEPCPEANVPLEDDAPRRLRREYRKFHRRADGLCLDSAAEAFHRARIGAKRVRYAAEFFEPLYGKPARRLVASATAVQDLLGEHQDMVVNRRRIEDVTASSSSSWPPATTLALGQLLQWEAQHGAELRRAFKPAYREVKAAWRRMK